ncbi:MAG: hypothetical protein JXR96_09555 [Deltaproteobacteria bacterium]|nr:hypothetical protein [Deltaproteobacteria bacterium]
MNDVDSRRLGALRRMLAGLRGEEGPEPVAETQRPSPGESPEAQKLKVLRAMLERLAAK